MNCSIADEKGVPSMDIDERDDHRSLGETPTGTNDVARTADPTTSAAATSATERRQVAKQRENTPSTHTEAGPSAGELPLPDSSEEDIRPPPGPACAKRKYCSILAAKRGTKVRVTSDVPLHRSHSVRIVDEHANHVEATSSEDDHLGVLPLSHRVAKGKGKGKGRIGARTGSPAGTSTKPGPLWSAPLTEVAPPLSPPKGKRGRPVTTGKGVGILLKLETKRREKAERARLRLVSEVTSLINNGLIEASRKRADPSELVPERDDPEAIKAMSTADLANGIGQCLGAVVLVGKKSGHIQGKLLGALNRAVDNLRLATSAMIIRLGHLEGDPASSTELSQEVALLRKDLAAARAEREALRASAQAETDALRADVCRLEGYLRNPFREPASTTPSRNERTPPDEGWPALGQKTRGHRSRGTPPPEPDTPQFDDTLLKDILPSEAPSPMDTEGDIVAFRPAIKGVSAPLTDSIPGLKNSDKEEHDILSNRISKLLTLRMDDKVKVDSPEWIEIGHQIDLLLAQRAKLQGGHGPWPADLSPLHSILPTSPAPPVAGEPKPAPAETGPAAPTSGPQEKGAKKKGKRKKKGGKGATTPAPPQPNSLQRLLAPHSPRPLPRTQSAKRGGTGW